MRLNNMTIEERRKREKDQRRENAINAANRLFFLKGYENVSMEDIAIEAELSKTTLYYYFNKESLFFTVVKNGIKILGDIIVEETESMQASGVKVGIIGAACNRFFHGRSRGTVPRFRASYLINYTTLF
jgi:AcrR family transcriptional regulator